MSKTTLIEFLVTSTREALGRPVTFERWLRDYPEARVPKHSAPPSVAEDSIVRWDRFGHHSPFSWPRRPPGLLPGWRKVGSLGYASSGLACRDLPLGKTLVSDASGFRIDIRGVEGLAQSKSDLEDFGTLDEMAKRACPSYLDDTPEALARNLAHNEIRILRAPGEQGGDHFTHYAWDGRVFLSNSGGSHHFAAARWIAGTLGEPVELRGTLYHIALDIDAALHLHDTFAIYAIADTPALMNAFHDALKAFEAPYYWISMPKPYQDARAIFLPRESKRAARIAELLCSERFFEVGEHLVHLAQNQVVPENVNWSISTMANHEDTLMTQGHEDQQVQFPKADLSSVEASSVEQAEAVLANANVRLRFRTAEGGEFSVANQDTTHHLLLSAAGTGKAFLLPSAARLQQVEEERKRVEEARLNAVREAFWNATPADHSDFYGLHDALISCSIVEAPTAEQIKAFFMMLPAEILGSALEWGFSDTVVRDRIHEFVEQNEAAVREALNVEPCPSPHPG